MSFPKRHSFSCCQLLVPAACLLFGIMKPEKGGLGTFVGSRATAKLMDAALTTASDAEIGLVGVSASVVPDWVVQAERIRTEIGTVKDKMNKLKE